MTARSKWHLDIEARLLECEKANRRIGRRLLEIRHNQVGLKERHEDLLGKTEQFANDITSAFNGLVAILEPVGAELKVELEP